MVACRKLRGTRGRRQTEATLAQLQKSENKGEEEDQKREDGIEKENSEED